MKSVTKFLTYAWVLTQVRHLGAEMLGVVNGVVSDPDPLDSESVAAAPHASEFGAARQWVWDLIVLAEELEQIAVWGQLSPNGLTRLTPREPAALQHRIPEIAKELAFYYELLTMIAGRSLEQGLWRRLHEEIGQALKGPGYEFFELRSALYSALRNAADAEGRNETAEEDEEDEVDETSDENAQQHVLDDFGDQDDLERQDDEADIDDGDIVDIDDLFPPLEEAKGARAVAGPLTTIYIISTDPMVSRGMMLSHILRVPFDDDELKAICLEAKLRVLNCSKTDYLSRRFSCSTAPTHRRRRVRSFASKGRRR